MQWNLLWTLKDTCKNFRKRKLHLSFLFVKKLRNFNERFMHPVSWNIWTPYLLDWIFRDNTEKSPILKSFSTELAILKLVKNTNFTHSYPQLWMNIPLYYLKSKLTERVLSSRFYVDFKIFAKVWLDKPKLNEAIGCCQTVSKFYDAKSMTSPSRKYHVYCFFEWHYSWVKSVMYYFHGRKYYWAGLYI